MRLGLLTLLVQSLHCLAGASNDAYSSNAKYRGESVTVDITTVSSATLVLIFY
jgi:hypothetical protein